MKADNYLEVGLPSQSHEPSSSIESKIDCEEVPCFRCGKMGKVLFSRPPFGIVRCPSCAQVFTSPRLRNLRMVYENPAYFEHNVYGFSRLVNIAFFLQRLWISGRLRLIKREMAKTQVRGTRLLEVGCAYGFFLEAAQRAGFQVMGIEFSQVAAQFARERLGLEVHHGELERSPLLNNTFDIVCFWDVIEHVANPIEFLRAVRYVTVPGGLVFFSCPCFDSLPARLFHSRWWTLRPEQHLSHFTEDTLKRLLSEADLQVVRIIRNPFSQANFGRLDSLVGVARKPDV